MLHKYGLGIGLLIMGMGMAFGGTALTASTLIGVLLIIGSFGLLTGQ